MESNDTVMSPAEREFYKENVLAGLEWQAEISFKAGYDQAMLECGRANGLALREGKEMGIKEVVEAIKTNDPWLYSHLINSIEMLAKLKEWGIE